MSREEQNKQIAQDLAKVRQAEAEALSLIKDVAAKRYQVIMKNHKVSNNNKDELAFRQKVESVSVHDNAFLSNIRSVIGQRTREFERDVKMNNVLKNSMCNIKLH
jgi:DNA-binding ferritin-like protein